MRTRIAVATGVALVVLTWLGVLLALGKPALTGYRIDLDVYRIGARVWLDGGPLYGVLPELRGGRHLPFTYPPISSVLLAPLALVSFEVASAAITLLTVGALVVVLVTVLRSLDVPPWPVAVALLAVALAVEPVRATVDFGQVNALLMALVVLDALVRTPRWPRGALIGLAAAVKLTPVLFVLFFLVRGDRRAVLTAGGSFVVATGVGFLFAGKDSMRYWTSTVFDSGRIGGVRHASNQSFTALFARLGIESTVVWAVLAAALFAATVIAMRRAFADGQHTWALALNALGALPLSPVSWSHHWVWAVPIMVTAGVAWWRWRAPAALALAAGGTALFVLSPHWWWHRDDPWDLVRTVSGHGYLIFAVVVVGLVAAGRLRLTATATERLSGEVPVAVQRT
ncbi:glycosyltransferase 87 family protein [Actinophytocola sediminis]